MLLRSFLLTRGFRPLKLLRPELLGLAIVERDADHRVARVRLAAPAGVVEVVNDPIAADVAADVVCVDVDGGHDANAVADLKRCAGYGMLTRGFRPLRGYSAGSYVAANVSGFITYFSPLTPVMIQSPGLTNIVPSCRLWMCGTKLATLPHSSQPRITPSGSWPSPWYCTASMTTRFLVNFGIVLALLIVPVPVLAPLTFEGRVWTPWRARLDANRMAPRADVPMVALIVFGLTRGALCGSDV